MIMITSTKEAKPAKEISKCVASHLLIERIYRESTASQYRVGALTSL